MKGFCKVLFLAITVTLAFIISGCTGVPEGNGGFQPQNNTQPDTFDKDWSHSSTKTWDEGNTKHIDTKKSDFHVHFNPNEAAADGAKVVEDLISNE